MTPSERIPSSPLVRLRDALIFHLVMALPGGWRGTPWRQIELWLLPYAAGHAYPWRLAPHSNRRAGGG